MFEYDNATQMKKNLDNVATCKTEEEKKMIDKIKHYLDCPLQLYALQAAEMQLKSTLKKQEHSLITENMVCQLAEKFYEEQLKDSIDGDSEDIEDIMECFLIETNLMPKDSPFNEENILFEHIFSRYDPAPLFSIQFMKNNNESEIKFTCKSGQNIRSCVRELYCLFEDYKKENPEIFNIAKVIYKGTDPDYEPQEKIDYLMKMRERNEDIAEYSFQSGSFYKLKGPYYCLIDKNTTDKIVTLKKTLLRLLENGWNASFIEEIMGGVPLSAMSEEELAFAKENGHFIDLDYGYCIVKEIVRFSRI